MKLVNKFLMGAAVCLVGANTYAAALPVDLFSADQYVVDDNSDDGLAVSSEVGPFGDILGGYRELSVECTVNCGGAGGAAKAEAYVENGVYSLSTSSLITGVASITWDGLASGGLGGIDITDAGNYNAFKLVTLFADVGPWQFQVNAVDALGNYTNILFVATPVPLGGDHVSYIPFAGFSACGASNPGIGLLSVTCSPGPIPVDLTNLDSLSVAFNVSGAVSIDLTLDSVEAVPEPSVMALLGTGLLSFGLAGIRRKRKSIAA